MNNRTKTLKQVARRVGKPLRQYVKEVLEDETHPFYEAAKQWVYNKTTYAAEIRNEVIKKREKNHAWRKAHPRKKKNKGESKKKTEPDKPKILGD